MEIFVEIIVYWNKNNNRTITWLLEGINRVASFAPERSKVANDATRETIIYARQKSCDYHYIIICNTQREIFAAASKMKTQIKPNKLN